MTRILEANDSSPGYVSVVDHAGNGDYQTIQAAINYQNTCSPSANNRRLVLVAPGRYIETLTLYDYIDVVGLGNDWSSMLYPDSDQAIDNFATCVVSNLRIVSDTSPIIQSGASATGKTLTLLNIKVEEDNSEIDAILIDSGTLEIRRCDLTFGGMCVDLNVGSLYVFDSRLNHYHTNGAAGLQHVVDCAASTSLYIERSTIENTTDKGSAIRFAGAMTACKVLHSILRGSSTATYSCVADVAVTLTIARCLLDLALDTNITAPALNDVNAGI